MLPTLPAPVLDHLLADHTLSRQDLARCCHVGRAFLDPARRTLYHQAIVGLVHKAPGAEYELLRSSAGLLDTLTTNDHLAGYVRELMLCKVPGEWPTAPGTVSAPMILARLLSSCRRTRRINLIQIPDDFAPVLLAARLPLTHLYLNNHTCWEHVLPTVPHLQHLVLRYVSTSPQVIPSSRPRHLSSFMLQHTLKNPPFPLLSTCLNAFCQPINNALRQLHLPASVFTLQNFDLSLFPTLRQLAIQMESGPIEADVFTRIVGGITKLSNLETLALCGRAADSPAYTAFKEGQLASHLPLSLRRLVVGSDFSHAEVVCLLAETALRGLKRLEWTRSQDSPDVQIKLLGLALVAKQLGMVFRRRRGFHSELDLA